MIATPGSIHAPSSGSHAISSKDRIHAWVSLLDPVSSPTWSHNFSKDSGFCRHTAAPSDLSVTSCALGFPIWLPTFIEPGSVNVDSAFAAFTCPFQSQEWRTCKTDTISTWPFNGKRRGSDVESMSASINCAPKCCWSRNISYPTFQWSTISSPYNFDISALSNARRRRSWPRNHQRPPTFLQVWHVSKSRDIRVICITEERATRQHQCKDTRECPTLGRAVSRIRCCCPWRFWTTHNPVNMLGLLLWWHMAIHFGELSSLRKWDHQFKKGYIVYKLFSSLSILRNQLFINVGFVKRIFGPVNCLGIDQLWVFRGIILGRHTEHRLKVLQNWGWMKKIASWEVCKWNVGCLLIRPLMPLVASKSANVPG